MRLLALETSEYVSSVALLRDGQVVAQQSFASRMNLCETLTAHIQEVLGGEAPAAALDALAVSQGPGSFTGLRVGMATAKALAHVCNLPLVGVPTQQVLAAAAEADPGETVCVLQKARQGHVYAGLWQRTSDGAGEVAPLEVVAVTDLPAWLAGRATLLLGPGADAAMDVLGDLPADTRLQATMPQAALVATLGAQRLAQADPHAAFNLQPLYVLASQAERQKGLDLSAPQNSSSQNPSWEGLPAPTPSSPEGPHAQPHRASGSREPGRMADEEAVAHAVPPSDQPSVLVRRATLADLRDIMRIEVSSFSSPWSELSIREELSGRPGSLFLSLELEGEIVGYAGAWLFAGEVHICTIAVEPERRRSGFAELLMLCVLRYAIAVDTEQALLEYRVSNHPAAALYKKLGFEFLHVRKRYYQDNGEDAVVVALSDLATPGRRRRLQDLYDAWLQRYPYEVRLEI